MSQALHDAMMASTAWPFEEARKLLARLEKHPETSPVLFETGYGPSGLPHIGTFGEVARTAMVRHAFECLAPGVETHLIAFSDDMDGMRKIPPNLPNQEMLKAHIGKPLSRVPDPFGTHESYAAHNNARLRAFLDEFGFAYEFMSSTATYASGAFDAALLRMIAVYDEVMAIILPTLGPERRATYSPFLPVSPKTGRVLQVPLLGRDAAAGTILFADEDGTRTELPVTGGHVKCQWKADWALRWFALGVDYEMAGKDLIDSVTLSSKIVRALGGTPPEGFNYELFLDDNGEKISKTRGNGLTIEEWLRYASPESLALFMYQAPRKAKRLYFDVIPRAVDDYLQFLKAYRGQDGAEAIRNPVWHIHAGHPPAEDVPLTFALLLNLVSASNSEDRSVLWGFIRRYDKTLSPEKHPLLDRLVDYAITYFHDFVKPAKSFRPPTDKERAALADLKDRFATLADETPDADGEAIQAVVYEVGKAHGFEPLRDWFSALYEVLLGQSQGPRFGSFVALYGLGETVALLERALAGGLAAPARS
ncbi:MAG: lysine--tRNA ligase [Alphaproteobacteria bacterium]|nr:lysine--tRNA ligase [Alphaproteobacteria bacterium]